MTDYLEGALSAEDRARFEEHVRACEGCEAYLDQMRATIWAVGQLCDQTETAAQRRDHLLEAFRDWRRRTPRP